MSKKIANSELERKTIDEYKLTNKLPIVIVLDNIRSQHNVGSVFRTSDAFLIEAIYLCGITSTPPNSEIHKTALGAQDTVQWKYYKSTLDALNELKKNEYILVAIEQIENSIELSEFIPDADKKYAIIFGNEVKGVEQEVVDFCDLYIEIAQYGTKHSLNVSVSAGIVIWEVFKKMKK